MAETGFDEKKELELSDLVGEIEDKEDDFDKTLNDILNGTYVGTPTEPKNELNRSSGRTKKKKKRKKKNLLLRFLIFVALIVGIILLAKSQLFDINSIAVENNSYYTEEQIIELAGATTGGNIFEADTRGMKNTLLADSYIDSATIKRKLPGTLVISVSERTEDFAIMYGTSYILMDFDGMVLRITDVEPQIPVLDGLTVQAMDPGKPLKVEETYLLSDTIKLLQGLGDSDMYFKRIDVSNTIIKAYIYDSLICKGTPSDIAKSISNGNLHAVVYDLYSKGTERGTISVGKEDYISFSPEML